MKVKERAVARGLEKLYPQLGTLEEPKDQFSPFDFECDKYIIEVKCRSQAWDPWFIEAIKYNSNMEIAKNRKKQVKSEKPIGYLAAKDATILHL